MDIDRCCAQRILRSVVCLFDVSCCLNKRKKNENVLLEVLEKFQKSICGGVLFSKVANLKMKTEKKNSLWIF